jgi:hypothetical protein
MARLKVKQISDIGTYVQGLIDNDSDQNAGLIDALEASVDSLELLAGGSVTADLAASVDSLENIDTNQSTSIANNASSIANNASSISDNADGIAENVKDIADLQTQADNNDADNLALTASVNSLELIDAGLATSITNLATSVADNDTRVDSILSNADVDLDQFTEVVAYVNSLDVLQGGELTDGLAGANASIDSLEVVASAAITSIDALQAADLVLDASVDSLEVVASAAIDSIDALEAADVVMNASIDSLETLAIDAFGAGVRIHQMGTVTGLDTFTIPTAVDSSSDADCLVFVNGKGEQMLINGVNSNGWSSVDGTTFTLTGIGYNIDGEDDVYVVAPYAGDAETTGTGGGEDYEDFFNARKRD